MIQRQIGEYIRSKKQFRVLFLNDLGFQYGAGIAELRQVQSFLQMGCEVAGLCWQQSIETEIPFIPYNARGTWLGMRQLLNLHKNQGCTEKTIISGIMKEVNKIHPDVVIIGNLHGAQWPLRLPWVLKNHGIATIVYMHDIFWVSGRCAYPAKCEKYLIGCDASCPTADEYPELEPSKIADAWKLRRALFCGAEGIPLVGNSNWTVQIACASLQGVKRIAAVHLGLDLNNFRPFDRSYMRRLLNLPPDRFIILLGAVNVNEKRKGVDFFKKLINHFQSSSSIVVFGENSLVIFGENSLNMNMRNIYTTGFLRDYRKMALLYSAADVFVGTALEEAFGQSLCEASACAVPVVAFDVGGTPEIIENNETGILVPPGDVEKMISAIEILRTNEQNRNELGSAGRRRVEKRFSLEAQTKRWRQYFLKFE